MIYMLDLTGTAVPARTGYVCWIGVMNAIT